VDFDFEINCFQNLADAQNLLSVRKCTEQSLFQILADFPRCFGKLALGKQLNWIWNREFGLADRKKQSSCFHYIMKPMIQTVIPQKSLLDKY